MSGDRSVDPHRLTERLAASRWLPRDEAGNPTVGLPARDGKQYPRGRLHPDDLEVLVGRAHHLAHEDGLSVRSISVLLGEEYGPWARRSVGTIHRWLTEYGCDHPDCAGESDSDADFR
jgi:hypothetical protein